MSQAWLDTDPAGHDMAVLRVMPSTTVADWQRWHRLGHRRLPFARVVPDEPLPATWEGFTQAPVSVLLESPHGGRYTYLCDRPSRVVLGDAEGAKILSPDGVTVLELKTGAPLAILDDLRREAKAAMSADWPPMAGGLIGAFGYDLVRTWERLPRRAQCDLPLPLYAMIETAELFVYDHAEAKLWIFGWTDVTNLELRQFAERHQAAALAADAAVARWRAASGPVTRAGRTLPPTAPVPSDSLSRDAFCAAVRRVKTYLAEGHTYQANLSLRQSRPAPAAPEAIYESVRRVNPSPYMGLLRLREFALVCGSPELLVRLVDGRIASRPIAGTRPRGRDETGDRDLSAELSASEKERAEHLMLVDLIRNDIGRVAEWGSVRVSEFMTVERYSHVMHLVSEVEGRLASGRTWVDVLRAMFPGGTITGCPKIRTMEIIEELEPVGRGFYTGSLGWIDYRGNVEMNIIIRTMLVERGLAHVQAGAGIVADSVPEREYDEAQHKARALWVAWEMAAQHG